MVEIILLINPPRFNGNPVVREMRCAGISPVSVYPPIKLANTAAVLENQGIDVRILDANANDYNFKKVKSVIDEYNPEIVVFTSSPTTMSWDMMTAKVSKEVNSEIITVLDDPHIAPVIPERVFNSFDYVDVLVFGESEFTILDLTKNIDQLEEVNGISYRIKEEVIINNPREPGDINSLPFPAYHLLPIEKYYSLTFARRKPFATIITSVGCPYKCIYCIIGGSTTWRGYGSKWRCKSAERVLDEIEYLNKEFKIKDFYFFDETFTANKRRVLDICDGLIHGGIEIEWTCNSRVDTIDEETVKSMKEAGCWNICYGVESGSEALLENINKLTTVKRAKETFKFSRKQGIVPSASFMLGLPGETQATIKETLALAKELDPSRAQFVITTPYPGTRLYEELKRSGLIEEDYSFSGFDAYCVDGLPVIRTEKMSSEEIKKAQSYIYRKFYLRPTYILKTLFRVRSSTELYNIIKFAGYM